MANASRKQAGKRDETAPAQTWNAISGTMRVYGNTFKIGKGKNVREIVKWSATVSGKNKDGEWVNYYVPVKFAGEDATEPETDKLHVIDITNAFWSVESYTNKDDEIVTMPVIVVTVNDVTE